MSDAHNKYDLIKIIKKFNQFVFIQAPLCSINNFYVISLFHGVAISITISVYLRMTDTFLSAIKIISITLQVSLIRLKKTAYQIIVCIKHFHLYRCGRLNGHDKIIVRIF